MFELLVDDDRIVSGDGFVFDLDGVLVDSEACWQVAENQAIEMLGGVLPTTREGIAGLSPDDAGRVLAERANLHGRAGELQELVEEIAVDVFRRDVVAIEGADRFVTAVRRWCPVVVATNSPRDIAEASLSASGLTDLVDVLVTVDEVGAGKPAPDLYREACRRVGAEPARTIAVEDSVTGYRAVLAAGLLPVVFGGLDPRDLPEPMGRIPAWSRAAVTYG